MAPPSHVRSVREQLFHYFGPCAGPAGAFRPEMSSDTGQCQKEGQVSCSTLVPYDTTLWHVARDFILFILHPNGGWSECGRKDSVRPGQTIGRPWQDSPVNCRGVLGSNPDKGEKIKIYYFDTRQYDMRSRPLVEVIEKNKD